MNNKPGRSVISDALQRTADVMRDSLNQYAKDNLRELLTNAANLLTGTAEGTAVELAQGLEQDNRRLKRFLRVYRGLFWLETVLVVIGILIALSGCATTPDQWSKEAQVLEATYQTIHAVDLIQTLDIKNHPELRESNRWLGNHPSDRSIAVWYIGTTYGHALVTSIIEGKDLPKWVDRTWQTITIGDAANAVRGNYQLGLKVRF